MMQMANLDRQCLTKCMSNVTISMKFSWRSANSFNNNNYLIIAGAHLKTKDEKDAKKWPPNAFAKK